MKDNFIFFEENEKNNLKFHKDIIYQKAENKIELFEKCLDEVGLNKMFPFFEPTRFFYLNKIFSYLNLNSHIIYPVDKSEELLMRNCIRRNIQAHIKITQYLNNVKEIKEI